MTGVQTCALPICVLVVPREIAYDVLIRAEEIKENEKRIFEWVHEGQTIQEIKDKGGYF